MASPTLARATIDDLLREEGKAELIGGRIVRFMASGELPSLVAFEIAISLRLYAKANRRGSVYTDGLGYTVPELTSGRQSFSPDASYFTGPPPANRMRFIEGAPDFAIEVRSENDYGKAADIEIAAKRADYFEAGTLAVWDVDPLAQTIAKYCGDAHSAVAVYHRGETADAEPAVPGWRLAVAAIFDV
jgi:Uma2 family endonuclease